jgi:hypothetical protein
VAEATGGSTKILSPSLRIVILCDVEGDFCNWLGAHKSHSTSWPECWSRFLLPRSNFPSRFYFKHSAAAR